MPPKSSALTLPRATPKLVFSIFAALCLISSYLLFWNLSKFPFTDYDEAIYAQVMKSTVQQRSFFVLYENGQPWFHKPPLYFWLAMGADRVFHHPELSYRLPAAVFGFFCIVLATLIAFELSSSPYLAAFAGFMLAGTGNFIESARQLRIEAGVLFAILFAFYAYLRAKKDQRWLIGIFVGVAIGIMFKSIIGAMSLPIICIFSFFNKDFTWLKNKYLWIGAALGFLILLPWHAYETYRFGMTFWQDYLFHQVLKRFVSNVNGGSSSNWGYVRDTFLYAFPWCIVFLAGIFSLFKKKFLGDRYTTMLSLVVSACFLFLVFFVARTKISYYVLPAIVLFPFIGALLFERWYVACRTVLQKRLFWVVLIGLVVIGLANSIYVGFHYQADFSGVENLVYEERSIGVTLEHQPSLPIVSFAYAEWDTIRYYSDNKDSFTLISNGYSTTSPVYMIMLTPLYKSQPFPSSVMNQLTPLYTGTWLTLLRFNPSTS